MPYQIIKIANKNKYKVINSETGKIFSNETSYENAIKQIRFLHMIMNERDKKK